MGLNFKQFASLYGLRIIPTIVTDADLDVKFVNHQAALLSVIQLGGDFIRKSLTPASMQKVQRCRRTGNPTVFTQFFGKEYRKKFRVTAEWNGKEYIVFSFYHPHAYWDEPPLTATLSEGNMYHALQNIQSLASLARSDSGISTEKLATMIETSALNAFRRARQEWYKNQDPQCYAFHMPTLLELILRPCNKLLEEKGSTCKIHYHKPCGDRMVKCDANLLCYVIYSLLSTAMSFRNTDATLQYTEYHDTVKLDIYAGKERPIIFSGFNRGGSRALCDSMGLTSTYLLAEKMQGELSADWLSDTEMIFSLTLPVSHADGGFKEHICSQLTELNKTLEIEFSIF